MKRVYDILLNYNEKPYEFYEWNKEDNILHIKSIIAFYVTNNCINDFINNEIKVEMDLLDIIKGKTEVYFKKNKKILEYACILFSEKKAIALEFDSNGKVINKSFLLFDEEDDIIENRGKINLIKFNYEILKVKENDFFLTRKESYQISNIVNYINNIVDKDELKYIYYECFNEEENSKNAFKKLKDSINNRNFIAIEKLNKIISLLKK